MFGALFETRDLRITNISPVVYSRADQIQKMFNEFDKDGSGSVSVSEAKDVLRKLKIPDHEIEALVAQHDKNNDGELQYEEFVSFLLHT